MPRPARRQLSTAPLTNAELAKGGLMTVKASAAYLGMHPKTVAKLYRGGQLPYRKLGYRTVRLYRLSVEAYAAREAVRRDRVA